MKQARTILALMTALAGIGSAQAQEAVDITLRPGTDGNLEVLMVPREDFDGIFSSLVFTLRWDATTGATLGKPVQNDVEMASLALERSGSVHSEGSMNYQIYSGLGMQTLADAGRTWEAGTEYTIATIPVVGGASVELVNDAWTSEERNNGDYYVSLGGQDLTGNILKGLATGGDATLGMSIVPNPNRGLFTISVEVPVITDLRIELVNATGGLVYSEQLSKFSGTFRKDMDLTGASSGVYYLKLRQNDNVIVRKVLFQ
jgi:hypothetical protein